MGFKDFFKPLWKHSDYGKRMAAVKRLSNPKALADVAKNDSHADIRITAIKNPMLTDQALLSEIAGRDQSKDVRKAAVNRLVDQVVLAQIAYNDQENHIRAAAVVRLKDEAALAEIARNDENWKVRKAAYEKLGNHQAALAEMAKHAEGRSKKMSELTGIRDQSLLADVAQHCEDQSVRLAAVEKLQDTALAQAVYADVLKSSDNEVRKAAVGKMTDQKCLADQARNDADWRVRSAAVSNPHLTDQDILFEIAGNDREEEVRREAVSKLTDRAMLARIARNDKNGSVRAAVVINPFFTDQDLLFELASNDREGRVRDAAVSRLTDQAMLVRLAKNDKNGYFRAAAVWNPNLTDQNILLEIAGSDDNEKVREAAARKLTDPAALILIVEKEKNIYVRLAAVSNPHLTDQDVLAGIANEDKCPEVRKEAKRKITDPKRLAEFRLKCPQCGIVPNETHGSPVSPWVNVYSCSCGWRKLRCGDRSCDGYLEYEERGFENTVNYICMKCGWSGTGIRFD